MPFDRPTLAQLQSRLRAEINASLEGADANLRHSPEAVIASVVAMASHEMHSYISWVSRQILLETADAEFLERHASEWGIYRKPASAASGRVRFTGTNGAVIPAGAIVKRGDDVEYRLDEDATITGGSGDVAVTAVEKGAQGNAAIDVKANLVNPVAGVSSEAIIISDGTGKGVTGGADIEIDTSLRARALSRKRQAPHGGAGFDYIKWAKEISGVTRAWVYPQQYGLGTVGVAFVMDNNIDGIIPGAADVLALQTHIEEQRPVTADVTVFAPTLVPIDFEIALNPNTLSVQNSVKAELNDLLMREGEPGKTILLSHIREAVSLAVGEYDHVVVTPSINVDLNFGEMPVLGTITWSAL